jgi:enoyl-[acyl-carrier-protein] reductase (NADH)
MGLPDLTGKGASSRASPTRTSIAYGYAKAFQVVGADLAITYRNAKAEPYVRPLAERLARPIVVPCDVRKPGQLDSVFEHVHQQTSFKTRSTSLMSLGFDSPRSPVSVWMILTNEEMMIASHTLACIQA